MAPNSAVGGSCGLSGSKEGQTCDSESSTCSIDEKSSEESFLEACPSCGFDLPEPDLDTEEICCSRCGEKVAHIVENIREGGAPPIR